MLSFPKHSLTERSAIVQELKEPELNWVGDPFYSIKNHKIYVDPFPSSSHNIHVIANTLQSMPIQIPVSYYALSYEIKERSNGYTTIHFDWDTGAANHFVVLSGKRTAIPPSMTKYITAHEYGHVVEDYLSIKLNNEELHKEYAQMRGAPLHSQWVNGPREVLADDFRILYTGVEESFWPHKGVANPLDQIEDIHAWWTEKINELNKILSFVC